MRLRILSEKDFEKSYSMREAIEVIANAYAMLSLGYVAVPQRIKIETSKGLILFMPAFLYKTGALAVKVVSVFEENIEIGLPTISAFVVLVDSETGIPLALMNGTKLTAIRTGAASGVATNLLAREDAHVFALFGAGGQAKEQVRAVIAVRPIKEIRIYTPSIRSASNLSNQLSMEYSDMKIQAVKTPSQAVRGADIITCVTTSHMPVFDPTEISPGTHINGIGSFTPEMREVQIVGLPKLHVFVDSYEAVLNEAGDIIQAIYEGYLKKEDLIEIGQVVLGKAKGRTSNDDITFFKSVGVAVQDAATAYAFLMKAEEDDLGVLIDV